MNCWIGKISSIVDRLKDADNTSRFFCFANEYIWLKLNLLELYISL